MSYLYLKKSTQPKVILPKKLKILAPKKTIASLVFIMGMVLLFSAVFPIISFSLRYSGNFSPILSPLSNKFYNQNSVLGTDTDYTHLSSWFIEKTSDIDQVSTTQTQIKNYSISIPKLKIDTANVTVGGDDLKNSLVQYPNTAYPGQLGNTVIFGHSVLPQFFNPKSYLTIFSTLFKLKQGDEILVNYDGISYKYLIEQMYEVEPSDLTVLEQRFDGRFLTVITCSPPGTYLRRLVIKAKIVDI